MGDILDIVVDLVTSLVFWGFVGGAIIAWYLLTVMLTRVFYSEVGKNPASQAVNTASWVSLLIVVVTVAGIYYFFVTDAEFLRIALFTILVMLPLLIFTFFLNRID